MYLSTHVFFLKYSAHLPGQAVFISTNVKTRIHCPEPNRSSWNTSPIYLHGLTQYARNVVLTFIWRHYDVIWTSVYRHWNDTHCTGPLCSSAARPFKLALILAELWLTTAVITWNTSFFSECDSSDLSFFIALMKQDTWSSSWFDGGR